MTKACAIDGCSRKIRTKSAECCEMHYYRIRRQGKPGAAESMRMPRSDAPCDVDGCQGKVTSKGMCSKHYARWVRHGDPITVLPRGLAPGDPSNPMRKEVPGYGAAHERIRRLRGPANAQVCSRCGGVARQWAYVAAGASERIDSPTGPYSRIPDDYAPMCVPCHKREDLDRIAVERGDITIR